MTATSFKELEHSGWTERAASYDCITHVTDQAIEPLIASFGDVAGMALLEVACGPGHLAARAAAQGATLTAIDFADTMVARAQANYPAIDFREGDAEQLAFPDRTFDGVVCAFGLLHLAEPERAITEAFRVLKSGGRYTYSVWCPPQEGGAFFGFLMNAIESHGDLTVPMPPAPPFYRFAEPATAAKAITGAGFIDYERTTVPVYWRGQQPSDAVDVIYKATVRTKALLERQTAAARAAIHEAIISGIEQYRVGDHYEVALPAVIVTARKP